MSDLVLIDHKEGALVLTLNRPERKNAFSKAMLGELQSALSNEIRDDTGAVVIHGAGGCFSAGADMSELRGTGEDIDMDDAFDAVTTAMRAAPVPVIAAIDGPCMGGSFDFAMASDVRIANSKAVFQVPATRIGLLYSPKCIVRMRKLLGRDVVMRMMVLGERFDSQAALRSGIVSQVIEGDSCLNVAVEMAQQAQGNVRGAVEATKWLLNAVDSDDYDPEFWEGIRKKLLSSSERQEAVAKAKARVMK
ncbi:MAG: enoyl-CoA hydratase/isomerase family protein [Rhodospirillales bacterium]|jgi:enoyl-CoA hydratase/carnithine racemase|nr:enoyl-CoA hydratase/isomerase family protein [Rhodospirillales bacterium]